MNVFHRKLNQQKIEKIVAMKKVANFILLIAVLGTSLLADFLWDKTMANAVKEVIRARKKF